MNAPARIEDFLPLPGKEDQYPSEFMETRGAVKLREDAAEVVVGACDPDDPATLSSIRRFHRKPVRFVRIERADLSSFLARLQEDGRARASDPDASEDDRTLLDKLANDAPVVNLVNSVIFDGIRAGASDIHIEAGPDGARVRYRVDGALRSARVLDKARFPAVASRVKIMANLNILERRLPQDGRITVSAGEERTDLRVSIVPVAGGESIVLRVLGRSAAPAGLDDLGFDPAVLSLLRRLFRIPHGLVLATGPTGSGKTTTLNSIIREIACESLKVVTIEDPVEFVIPGVNQIQTNEQIGLGFDSILRRVLRQDPNVVMVGEIRDRATAELSVRAALTGHLVLSTLHTNDAASVVARLVDMGVEPYLLASVLRGALAQRLVRRTCPACARPRLPSEREARLLSAFGLPADGLREGEGCAACGLTGFKGRLVVAEAFESDQGLEELVSGGARSPEVASYLEGRGMKSLARVGMEAVASGRTTLRELEREVSVQEGGR